MLLRSGLYFTNVNDNDERLKDIDLIPSHKLTCDIDDNFKFTDEILYHGTTWYDVEKIDDIIDNDNLEYKPLSCCKLEKI